VDLACGHGRIANRLAARGAEVTGIDATPRFVEFARADAARRGVSVDYVEGDLRRLPWTERFDAAVCWVTSFGYFDDEQNRRVLAEAQRALRPGGRLLLDLHQKEGLLRGWLPSSVTHTTEGMMIDERTFDPLTSRVNDIRTIVRNGAVRRATFFTRLFGFTELRDWLLAAGFTVVDGLGGDGGPLTAESFRMLVVARK
jgi:SAM-dependent methyltransferase